ncbi:MAG: amino acid ABC transporter substrate-binding protein [Alphaproteobacteria bacterium]|nr:amino acid ABC transporter substrate-binding protein [Alphaproteobacteria bacterium]
MVLKMVLAAAAAAAVLAGSGAADAGATLDAIKARGSFKCGVGTGTPGFHYPGSDGVWRGFNVSICRAIAVALFNDPNKVEFVPFTAQQRFPALQTGEVDILSNNTTWTLTRDSQLGFNFGPTVFYDGQGFMVNKKLGVKSAKQLGGATVCVQPGTTTELNLTDYFREHKLQFTSVVIEQVAELRAAFFGGRCDVYTNDSSALAADRSAATNPDDYIVLPERISKEPLGPLVRHGDDQWFDVMKWTVYAMIEAEEFGIKKTNLDSFANTNVPQIKRLLGMEPGMGKALGLDDKFAYNIIKTIGNYGDIFETNLGAGSAIKLERGMNDLWTRGGMQYAIPFR